MSSSPIDYEALARKAGALISQPAGVDYTALAAKAGALASRPAAMVPDAGAQMGAGALGRAREEMEFLGDPDPAPKQGFHIGDVFQAINPMGIAREYVEHMNNPYETARGAPGGSLADVLPVTPAIQAVQQVQNRDYGGAASTALQTGAQFAVPIVGGKLLGAGARAIGRRVEAARPSVVLEPQLDPAEARAVQYGHEEGVQMPASVQSGSPAIAHGEKILQHFPLASKVAKTARAAEQSTLAAAGAREVADLGSPEAGTVPSAIEVGEAIHGKVDQSIANHAASGQPLAGS